MQHAATLLHLLAQAGTLGGQRHIVLRDLVPLGQVRVEVLLAVKFGAGADAAAQAQAGGDGFAHRLSVEHGQRALRERMRQPRRTASADSRAAALEARRR